MTLRIFTVLSILLSLHHHPVEALDNGLGLVPSMGFNTWYDLFMNPTESTCMDLVQIIIKTGLYDAGYTYFNLDDGVFSGRTANGTLIANPTQFPNGIKYLSDYVHSQGMKFGIYTDRGTNTCGGRPGAQGYEVIDAQTFANLGVDFLKEDSCNAPQDHPSAFKQYAAMRDALNKTGRPIYFNLCGWNPWYAPVGSTLANSWRTGNDDGNWAGILGNIDNAVPLAPFAGPGGFNDLDYLLRVDARGNVAQTDLQARAQFSLYAVITSPLIISQDLRNITQYGLETYLNREIIAVNQDRRGAGGIRLNGTNMATCYTTPNCINYWGKPLLDGSWVVAIVNAGTKDSPTLSCNSINCLTTSVTGWTSDQQVKVRDLWLHKDVAVTTLGNGISFQLSANGGVVVYKFTPVWN